jgi:predicted acyl esterase
MFSQNWQTSPRAHGVQSEFNVMITMSDGVRVAAQIFRPSSPGRFPAIIGVHAYDAAMQHTPSRPQAVQGRNAQAEAGDPQFFVRRGYAHVIVNARGTGVSEGEYAHYSPREVQDVVEVIAWIAEQDWCDGNVGMFGVSYFAVCAKQVAAQNPPALKAVFAPYGYTDFYRDKFYHGGILAHSFLTNWSKHLAGVRVKGWSNENLGEVEYKRRLSGLRNDRDIMAVPELAAAVMAPDKGANPLIVDVLLNPENGPYWHERNPKLDDIKVPILIGSSWDMYFLHLPGEFRAWEKITAPKKLIVGPPIYLDRPLYQFAFESLRWFDHWLKGNDTGYMNEPDVRVFVTGDDGSWKTGNNWPLPETVWHPFFLHGKGLLSEHEHWPHEGGSSYEDNSFNARGGVNFASPPMVERTEVIGPLAATIYASTNQPELLLFASLWDIDPEGGRRLLTRGWLKGSLSKANNDLSKPWLHHHDFTAPEAVDTTSPQRFDINLVPTANVFQKGHRIGLRISSADQEPTSSLFDMLGQGHLLQQNPSWVTIHHNADNPSVLHVPVTSGNLIGTFMSGGEGAARKTGAVMSTGSNNTAWDDW